MPATIEQTIQRSLERCAELQGDISEAVYAEFYQRAPLAEELLAHTDQYVRGRMIDATLILLMEGITHDEGSYLRWEVDNHVQAYGVDTSLYPAFLQALRQVVCTSLGNQWSSAMQDAWQHQIDKITELAQSHGAAQ